MAYMSMEIDSQDSQLSPLSDNSNEGMCEEDTLKLHTSLNDEDGVPLKSINCNDLDYFSKIIDESLSSRTAFYIREEIEEETMNMHLCLTFIGDDHERPEFLSDVAKKITLEVAKNRMDGMNMEEDQSAFVFEKYPQMSTFCSSYYGTLPVATASNKPKQFTFLKINWMNKPVISRNLAKSIALFAQRICLCEFGERIGNSRNFWEEVISINQFDYGKPVPLTVSNYKSQSPEPLCSHKKDNEAKKCTKCLGSAPVCYPLCIVSSTGVVEDFLKLNIDHPSFKYSQLPTCLELSLISQNKNSKQLTAYDLNAPGDFLTIVEELGTLDFSIPQRIRKERTLFDPKEKNELPLSDDETLNPRCKDAIKIRNSIRKFDSPNYRNIELIKIKKVKDGVKIHVSEPTQSRFCPYKNGFHVDGVMYFKLSKGNISIFCTSKNCSNNKALKSEKMPTELATSLSTLVVSTNPNYRPYDKGESLSNLLNSGATYGQFNVLSKIKDPMSASSALSMMKWMKMALTNIHGNTSVNSDRSNQNKRKSPEEEDSMDTREYSSRKGRYE